VYNDETASDYATAVVATETGSTLSFATPVQFGTEAGRETQLTYNSEEGTVVIAHVTSALTAYVIVGSITGTTISFGTPVLIPASVEYNVSVHYHGPSGLCLVLYRDHGNRWGIKGFGILFSA
jgi:hypothetical protein